MLARACGIARRCLEGSRRFWRSLRGCLKTRRSAKSSRFSDQIGSESKPITIAGGIVHLCSVLKTFLFQWKMGPPTRSTSWLMSRGLRRHRCWQISVGGLSSWASDFLACACTTCGFKRVDDWRAILSESDAGLRSDRASQFLPSSVWEESEFRRFLL